MDPKQIGGAFAAGLIDAGLEIPFELNPTYWAGKFPYITVVDPLPPVDDLLVGVAAAIPLVAGIVTKKKAIEDIGWGMMSYAGPMLLHKTIIRAVRMSTGTLALTGNPHNPTYVPSRPGLSTPTIGYRSETAPIGPVGVQRQRYTGIQQRKITVGPYAGGITAPRFSKIAPKYILGS